MVFELKPLVKQLHIKEYTQIEVLQLKWMKSVNNTSVTMYIIEPNEYLSICVYMQHFRMPYSIEQWCRTFPIWLHLASCDFKIVFLTQKKSGKQNWFSICFQAIMLQTDSYMCCYSCINTEISVLLHMHLHQISWITNVFCIMKRFRNLESQSSSLIYVGVHHHRIEQKKIIGNVWTKFDLYFLFETSSVSELFHPTDKILR